MKVMSELFVRNIYLHLKIAENYSIVTWENRHATTPKFLNSNKQS
jgi:hypothetical protein